MNVLDCTPYPHYYDVLVPAVMILAVVFPVTLPLWMIYWRTRK